MRLGAGGWLVESLATLQCLLPIGIMAGATCLQFLEWDFKVVWDERGVEGFALIRGATEAFR
jgi:hypothetical protein